MRPSYDMIMGAQMFPQMPDTGHHRGGKLGLITIENMLITQFQKKDLNYCLE
jgi:hypothetical protein